MSDLNSVESQIRLLNTVLSEKLDTQNALLERLVERMDDLIHFLNNKL